MSKFESAKKAVFLSYASQDTEAARRICDSLRAAGVEVWFDQSELVGGDAWDAKIRKQIKECALLVPIISAATQSRTEGYFRLEWRLADQRTHLMAKGRPFLLPVVIDGTTDADAAVPDSFAEVQWTRAPDGDVPPAFAARVKKMVAGEVSHISDLTHSRGKDAAFLLRAKVGRRVPATAWVGLATVLGLGIAGWVGLRLTAKTDVSMSPPVLPEAPLSEAQQLLAKIAAIVDKDADAGREDWLLAENLGAQVVKLEPANAEAWAAYSRAALGRFLSMDFSPDTSFITALQRARQAVALGPESTEAKLALALAYTMESKTRTEAETILRPLLEQHPNDHRLWRARGTLAQLQKQYDEALTFYDRADASPEGDPVSCRLKAAVLSGLGRYDEAERSIERSLELRPGPAAHLMKLIFLATVRDDLPQACALLEKLPGSYFLRDDTTYCAVQLWMWNREPAKAVRLLVGWRGNYIGDSPKGTALGEAYLLMGRAEAAQQAWRSALALVEKQIAEMVTGSDPMEYYAKARLLALLGEKTAAEEAARLWEQSDVYAVSGQNKAALLVLLGKNEEALAALPKQPWNGLASHPGFLGRLSPGGASYRYDPIWDPLRGDPRFEKLAAGYRTMWGLASDSKSATGNDAKSVAVLAFANLSDDKANEYFSDGISEELINVLGKIPGLKVPARTSSFYFKNRSVPISEIAQQLAVAYVIEGSVQRAGDKVKIGARLTKAADGYQVWSELFTRDAKDVFAVEEEIAGLIAKQLSLKLGANSAAATASVNPQALELYVQARQAWNLRTLDGYDRAETLLNQALVLEPNFARAQSALADVWLTRDQGKSEVWAFDKRDSPAQRRIIAKIQQALALDDSLAETHASLGLALWMNWRSNDAVRELRRAIALNPNYASAHQWLGRVLLAEGHFEAARTELETAVELDPFSWAILDNAIWALELTGNYREALAMTDRALQAGRADGSSHLGRRKVVTLMALGRREEAVKIAREMAAKTSGSVSNRILALADVGLKAEAEALLPQISDDGMKTRALAALGHYEESIASFNTSLLTQPALSVFFYERWFDPIREDPRVVKVLATLGMTEAHARVQAWRAAHPPRKP